MMWHAMSPSVPVPKPTRLRHSAGWYTPLLNGRSSPTPSHPFQSSVGGTGSAPGGIKPSSPQPFSQKACTSFTLPIAPLRTIASGMSCEGIDDTWMPICVCTRWLCAYSVSLRTSRIVAHSGF